MFRNKLSKPERSWVLYDVANSAFVMLSSTLIPIYFASFSAGDSVVVAWGYAETVASLILALLMPILGSLADLQGNKKKFLVGFVCTGAVACACLGLPKSALPFLVIYVLSAILLNGSMVFYDAFLVDATTEDRFDEVSSQGYAWGYIGSCIPFIACLLAVMFGPDWFGYSAGTGMKIAFFITAAWWLAFSIPIFKNVHQTHYKPRMEHVIKDTFSGLLKTIKNIIKDKRILLFILAYFFFIDGVHTIIKMATSYGTDLGIDSTQLVLALLVTQFVAFPSAIVYGRMASKFGAKKMLLIAIGAYFCITLFAAFFLKRAFEFWILAIAVGLFQGGIQALSRSEFGRLIPHEHANEYYGFFDIFGKYAAVMGTLLVALFTQITGNSSIGVLSIAVLFIIGFVLLLKMPKDDIDAKQQ